MTGPTEPLSAFAAAAVSTSGVAAVCTLAVAAARSLEPRLLFGKPTRLRPGPTGPHPDAHFSQRMRLPVGDGVELEGVLTRPLHDAFGCNGTRARTTLLWFGGRNEDIRWTPAIAGWLGSDFAVASFAYRGALGSGGRPSEAHAVADALRIVEHLAEETRVPDTRLLLAGRSLGSAVALQLAARLGRRAPPVGLVLLSPMDSMRSLAAARLWPAPLVWAMRSPFDSVAVAGDVTCPVLMLLAEDDRLVPHRHSMRLAQALRSSMHGAKGRLEVARIAGTDHKTLPRAPSSLAAIATFVHALDA